MLTRRKCKTTLIALLIILFMLLTSLSFASAASLGDVNADGEVDVQDVVLVMRHVLEIDVFDHETTLLADVNNDGAVDINDVVLIMRYALGIINEFPKTEPPEQAENEPGAPANEKDDNGWIVVPAVTGMSLQEAEEMIVDAGLILGEITYVIIIVPEGRVYEQDPVEGTEVEKGSAVNLTVGQSLDKYEPDEGSRPSDREKDEPTVPDDDNSAWWQDFLLRRVK